MSLEVDLPSEKCLTEGCNKKAKWKGICQSCYGVALQLIEREETTWDDLALMGMVTIEKKPFLKAFMKKKGAKPDVS